MIRTNWTSSSEFFTRFSRWFRFSEDYCRCISIDFSWSSRLWDCLSWFYETSRRWQRWLKSRRLRLNRLTRIARRSRSRLNVKDSWKSADLSFLFVIFDSRKNLSIVLFRIKKSFLCLLRTWWDDDIEIDIDDDWNDWNDWNDCLSEFDEDSRVFKSKRSVSLEKSKMNFRKNWLEMTDVKIVSEEQYSKSRSKFFWYATIKSWWVW